MKREKSNRAPFAPRRFIVSDTAIRDRAAAALANMPVDPLRPLLVTIDEEPKRRHNRQNALYWVRLAEISEQAWLAGKQYSSDVWHEYARQNVMPDMVTDSDGVFRSKREEMPDGSTTIISTTKLDQATFAAYVTALEAFGAALGVEFSANPNEQ